MPLILRVQAFQNLPPPDPLIGRFGPSGGTIGRATSNDLVLPDTSKYISRSHARIECRGGDYYLLDGGSNPSVVNDRPLGNGREVRLYDADKLVVGDYLLQVQIEPEPAAAVPPPEPTPIPAPDATLVEPDPLASAWVLDVGKGFDPAGPAASNDPLGLNLFGSASALPDPLTGKLPAAENPLYRGSHSDHVAPINQPFSMPAMAIPDDYDPLADQQPRQALPPIQNPPPVVTVAPVAPPEPVAAPESPLATPQPEPFPETEPTVAALPQTQPPRENIEPPAAQPQATPAHTAGSAPASDSDVLQALLRGLGVTSLNLQNPSPAAQAELIGQMLRQAVGGTMDVLRARAMTKREIRADMTMIAARDNNPLKFFPDAQSALTQMLSGQSSGYLAPLKAIDAAFDDLKAHELSVMAGMRAALLSVLQRFDPAAIEAALREQSVMDKMLSASRKAKLWDRLVEMHQKVSREAEDDFQRLFGESFTRAYEEQMDRLYASK